MPCARATGHVLPQPSLLLAGGGRLFCTHTHTHTPTGVIWCSFSSWSLFWCCCCCWLCWCSEEAFFFPLVFYGFCLVFLRFCEVSIIACVITFAWCLEFCPHRISEGHLQLQTVQKCDVVEVRKKSVPKHADSIILLLAVVCACLYITVLLCCMCVYLPPPLWISVCSCMCDEPAASRVWWPGHHQISCNSPAGNELWFCVLFCSPHITLSCNTTSSSSV